MTATRGAEVRALVAKFFDEGLDDVGIAARVGITVSRVNEVLDFLEVGHLAALPPTPVLRRDPAGPKPPAPAPAAKQRNVAECGTESGYTRHYARGEKPCDDCKAAKNALMRTRRASKRVAKVAAKVCWLIPRGFSNSGGDLVAEYGIRDPSGKVRPVSFRTAEFHAADGDEVLTRWVSFWKDARS